LGVGCGVFFFFFEIANMRAISDLLS
jgi:hypothetical protein